MPCTRKRVYGVNFYVMKTQSDGEMSIVSDDFMRRNFPDVHDTVAERKAGRNNTDYRYEFVALDPVLDAVSASLDVLAKQNHLLQQKFVEMLYYHHERRIYSWRPFLQVTSQHHADVVLVEYYGEDLSDAEEREVLAQNIKISVTKRINDYLDCPSALQSLEERSRIDTNLISRGLYFLEAIRKMMSITEREITFARNSIGRTR